MKTEEKKALITKGEEVYQAGIVFADKVEEWTLMLSGIENIEEKIDGDEEFKEINDKLGQLNDRLENFM